MLCMAAISQMFRAHVDSMASLALPVVKTCTTAILSFILPMAGSNFGGKNYVEHF